MSVIRIDIARRHRRRRRRTKVVFSVIGMIVVCLLLMGVTLKKERCVARYEYKTTDTLWGLLEYCPENMDRWEYLNFVMELNGMQERLVYPNRLYQVPVFEK